MAWLVTVVLVATAAVDPFAETGGGSHAAAAAAAVAVAAADWV